MMPIEGLNNLRSSTRKEKGVTPLLTSIVLCMFAISIAPSSYADTILADGSMTLIWNPVADVAATNDQTTEYEARSDAGFKPYYHGAVVFREERPESGLGWALQISDLWQPFSCWPIGCKGVDHRALLFNRIAPEGGIRRITFTIDETKHKNAMFYNTNFQPRFRIFHGENPQHYQELLYPNGWSFAVSPGGVCTIEFIQPMESTFVKLSVPDTTGGRDTAYFNTGPGNHFQIMLEGVPTYITPGVPFTLPQGGKIWVKDENFSDQHFVLSVLDALTTQALISVKSDLHAGWSETLTAGQSTILKDSRLELFIQQVNPSAKTVTAVIYQTGDIAKIEAKNTLKQNKAYVFKRLSGSSGADGEYEEFSATKIGFSLDASAFVNPADPVWPGLNLQKSHVMLEIFYEDTTTNDPADEDNEVELFTRNRWNPNRNQLGAGLHLDENPEWMEVGQVALGDDRDIEGGWEIARFLFPRDLFPRLRAFDDNRFYFAFLFDSLGTTNVKVAFVRLTEIDETTLHYFQTRLWSMVTEKNPLDGVHQVKRKEPIPAAALTVSNPFTLFKRPLIQRIFRHTVPEESERLTGPLSTFVAKGQKRVVNLGLRTGSQFVTVKSISATNLPHITVEPHYVHYTLRKYGEARTQYMLDEQPSILTKLSETNPADLRFRPGESHQFWLTVTPAADAPAGIHTGTLVIKGQYDNGVVRTILVPFSVNLLDFDLVENPIKQILAVDLRGEYYGGENDFVSPSGLPASDYQQPIVDDIIDHGQTPRDTASHSPHFGLIDGETGAVQLDEYANWLEWCFQRGVYKKDDYTMTNILHLHDQVAQALHGVDSSFPDPYGLWINGDYWWNQMADPRYKSKYKEVIRALHGLLTDPAGTTGGTNWRAVYPHLEPLRPAYVNMDEPTKDPWIRAISYREAQIFHELKTVENLDVKTFVAWKVELRDPVDMNGTEIPSLFDPANGIVFDRLSVNPGSLMQGEMTKLVNESVAYGNRFGFYSTWYSSQDVPLNNYFSRLYAWRIKADHIREYHYRENQSGLLGHDSPFKGNPMHNTYAFAPASWGTRNPVTGEYTRTPLTTVAWEMVREGNNMSRYLGTLKDRMIQAGFTSSSVPGPTRSTPTAAYRLAEKAAAYVGQFLGPDWWKDEPTNTLLTAPARINPYLADRYYKKAWTVDPYDEFEQLVLADWGGCYDSFDSYHAEQAPCADYSAFEKFEQALAAYIVNLDALLNPTGPQR